MDQALACQLHYGEAVILNYGAGSAPLLSILNSHLIDLGLAAEDTVTGLHLTHLASELCEKATEDGKWLAGGLPSVSHSLVSVMAKHARQYGDKEAGQVCLLQAHLISTSPATRCLHNRDKPALASLRKGSLEGCSHLFQHFFRSASRISTYLCS